MDVAIHTPARGLELTYRPLRELVPYARNARTHSADQIKAIRASMAHYGWTNPMLIAGNTMIAGHARLRAALDMAASGQAIPGNADPWMGPTIDLSHLSETDRQAYVIADNQYALLAGWDKDLLRADMAELRLSGFDLSLTGFKDLEVDLLLGGQSTNLKPTEDRRLDADEQAIWDRAWVRLMLDWQAQFEATRSDGRPISTSYTKGALAVWFTRVMLFGGEIPRGATLAYQAQRLFVNADKLPLSDLWHDAMDSPGMLQSIRWQCDGRPAYDKVIAATLAIHSHRAPADFPAHLARDLIDEFCPSPGAAILDPCHGWGGRLLGFLLSQNGQRYHGFDVAHDTQAGVRAMAEDLMPLCLNQDREVHLALHPFQEASLASESYDFAITSPPYYDVEKYDGERQSWREFPTLDAWVEGFFVPLIRKTADALKPGATFALQVGSQNYPLTRMAKQIGHAADMELIGVRQTQMANNNVHTDAVDGEVIVLLRKNDGTRHLLAYALPETPDGYLAELPGVIVQAVTTQDEVKEAIRIRREWAGKTLYPLPPVVYHNAMEAGLLFGAFGMDGMLGYMLLKRKRRENVLEIQQIAVMDSAPTGVGRRLVSRAWDIAVDGGFSALIVTTLADNDRARKLYLRFGFREDGLDGKDVHYRMDLGTAEPTTNGLGGEVA